MYQANAPKSIEIVFDTDGSTNIEAIGFKGKGCTEATAAIEKALSGGKPVARNMKPEAAMTEMVTGGKPFAKY